MSDILAAYKSPSNPEEEQLDFEWTIARHFYDLGCRRTAEKYDEIEYNRQRASGSSEIPNDLEEAANVYSNCYSNPDGALARAARRAYITGAKWQADHTPLPEDTVLFQKGVEEGKRLMMEEAVDVHIAESFNPVSDNLGTFLHGFSCIYEVKESTPYMIAGEHVKIIIVKED